MKANYHKKAARVICLLMSMLLLAGCSETIEINMEPIAVTKEKSALEKQELENPVSQVHIMVDKNGYETKDDKMIFFTGVDENREFYVIDKATRDVVYQGETYKNGEVLVGEFTDLDSEGEYYVETKEIGRSNYFSVAEGLWAELFKSTLEKTQVAEISYDSRTVIESAMGVHIMALALQCYPDVFESDNTLITWMLKTATSIMGLQGEDGSYFGDYKATAACAGVMRLCAEQFGKYDEQLATDFKNTSEKAYGWMVLNDVEADLAAKFYYMCHCFHADKELGTYKSEIESYMEKNSAVIADNLYSFLGASLYISSEKNTDRDICTKIMQSIVSKIEKISSTVKKKSFLVDDESLTDIMNEVLLVCFIDYITPSREYMDIIKNTMHYLLGANESNEILLQNTEEWSSLWSCISIFCLADINS